MEARMKPFINFIIGLAFLLPPAIYSQTTLKWLNRTGTQNDRLFDSRIHLNPDYLYHPLTGYQYFNYVEWRQNYVEPRQLDEFEKRRLHNCIGPN